MIFDVTKVTYSTYSCAISGMSREMMKMDGRGCVEYQIWRKKGYNGHFRKVFKALNDKIVNSAVSNLIKNTKKTGFEPENLQWPFFLSFSLERETSL